MPALGADAMMIGRSFSIAAVGGIQARVAQYIQKIHNEFKSAMILTGTANVGIVERAIVRT